MADDAAARRGAPTSSRRPLGDDVDGPDRRARSRSRPATRWPTSPTRSTRCRTRRLDLAVEQAVLRRNIADSLRQPRPPQPEPARPPARLHHRARAQRDRPRHARRTCSGSTTSPPACAATPSRCSCWPASSRPASGRPRSGSPTSSAPPSARSRTTSGSSSAASSRPPSSAPPPPTSPTSSPSSSRTPSSSRRPTRPSRSKRPARPRRRPGYTLAIIDIGLGMPAGDLAPANRRLAGAESFTVAPSKYLGHYVAGNLAAATASASRSTTRPATASPPRSTCRSGCSPATRARRPDAGTAGSRGVVDTGSFRRSPPLHRSRPRSAPGPTAPGVRRRQPRRARPVRRSPPAAGRSPGPAARAGADPHRERPGQAVAARHRRRARRHRARRRAARQPVEHRQQPAPLGPGAARPAATGPGAPAPAAPPADPWTPSIRAERAGRARSWPAPPELGRPTAAPAAAPVRSPSAAATVAVPESPAARSRPAHGLARRRGRRRDRERPRPPRAGRAAALDPAAEPPPTPGAPIGPAGRISSRRSRRRTRPHAGEREHQWPHERAGNGHDRDLLRPAADTGDHDNSAADSVYGFLTSFTQGVQRGLEETRRDPNGPEENP